MRSLRFSPSAAALAAALLLTLPAPVGAQAPPACDTPEARQFDFWIGEWEVRIPDGSVAGHNTIRKILNGCVLHESYASVGGYAGESFNIYDATRGVWHQSWVDLGGLLLLLEGGFEDGVMVLEGETTQGPQTVKQRIQWSLVDGNADRVRQLWESSVDGGESWTVAFDGLYVRKSGGPSSIASGSAVIRATRSEPAGGHPSIPSIHHWADQGQPKQPATPPPPRQDPNQLLQGPGPGERAPVGTDKVDRLQERSLLEPGETVPDLGRLGWEALQHPVTVLFPEDLHGTPA